MQLTAPATAVVTEETILNEEESAVIKTLLYFDLFSHPLTVDEIERFSSCSFAGVKLPATLSSLIEKKLLFSKDKFYSLDNNSDKLILRLENNSRANAAMNQAKFFSTLISKFPYVRAVFISGSLSKGVLHKDGDVDYFIITAPNRLWLCRTLLVLFKKIFLLNSHKYFCVNYFIDENQLEIPDKNIFTATEIVTLMPMVNSNLYKSFTEKNKWTKQFLPNTKQSSISFSPIPQTILKTVLEKMFSGKAGGYVDSLFLKKTVSFWKKKYQYRPEIDFIDSIRVGNNVAKYHPNRFQEKVLDRLEERIKLFEIETGYSLLDSEKLLLA